MYSEIYSMPKSEFGVFLDRDGVINEEVNLLHRKEDLKLIEGSAEGIKLLNGAGIPVIIVTNQPIVARGLCTHDEAVEINKCLIGMLAEQGAEIDGIYFCPHSAKADLPEYRKECHYRKPNAGMLEQAASDFRIALRKSYVVGDMARDIEAGKNAGCITILVKTGYGGKDPFNPSDVKPDRVCENLLGAAKFITAPNGF